MDANAFVELVMDHVCSDRWRNRTGASMDVTPLIENRDPVGEHVDNFLIPSFRTCQRTQGHKGDFSASSCGEDDADSGNEIGGQPVEESSTKRRRHRSRGHGLGKLQLGSHIVLSKNDGSGPVCMWVLAVGSCCKPEIDCFCMTCFDIRCFSLLLPRLLCSGLQLR